MSFKVEYTDKAGKAVSAVFGSEKAAQAYARSIKGAKVVPAQVAAKAVEAAVCPVGTIEAQKAATNAYYRSVREPEVKVTYERPEPMDAEQRAEMMAEHFFEARILGVSSEDAWSDWDHISNRD